MSKLQEINNFKEYLKLHFYEDKQNDISYVFHLIPSTYKTTEKDTILTGNKWVNIFEGANNGYCITFCIKGKRKEYRKHNSYETELFKKAFVFTDNKSAQKEMEKWENLITEQLNEYKKIF